MALIDYEHFSRETNGYYSNWFNLLGDCNPDVDGSGPFGYGRAARGYQFGRTFPTPINDFWVQFHFYLPAFAAPYGGTVFLALQNSSSVDNVSLSMDFGVRQIYMNYQTGFTACNLGSFAYDSWNFLQCRVHIGNLDGSIEVWQNGVLIGSIANVDTEGAGGPHVNQWRLTSGNQIYFANLVIYTEAGAVPNARTPETRIYAALANGAGATTGFTPTGATNNWECIDEQPSDNDTTYVSAAAAATSDLYAYPAQAIAAGAAVYGVAVEYNARKDDAGANEIDALIRSGGTTYAGGSPNVLTATYQRFRRLWTTDPATAAQWTVANANAAQTGVRRTT